MNNPIHNKKTYIAGIHQFVTVGTGSTSVPITNIISQPDVNLMTLQNGNVGIGTVNPTSTLHVIGNVLASGTVTASNISVIGDFVTLNTITSNTEQMVITNAGTGPALKVSQTGDNSVAEFYDNESGIALFVGNNGNVGVGTMTPSAPFHVVGTTSNTIRLQPPAGASGSVSTVQLWSTFGNYPSDVGPRYSARITSGFQDASTGIWGSEYLAFGVGNNGAPNDTPIDPSEKIRITSSGNVGIGTTNPQAKLDVNGIIKHKNPAFQAHRNATSVPANAVIVFQTILLNQGGCYNNTTGVFTAPIQGLYRFHFHSMTNNVANYPNVYIRKNGTAYIGGHGGATVYSHVSASCIIELNIGDTVDVWNVTNYAELHPNFFTAFSGHYIG